MLRTGLIALVVLLAAPMAQAKKKPLKAKPVEIAAKEKAPEAKPAEAKAPEAKAPEAKPAEAKSPAEAVALAVKVQQFYEKTKDFTADFSQSYRYMAMQTTKKSSGTVQVKKPGFMRWDYTKPYAKLFLLDGKTFYAYEPEDNAVIVNRKFSSDTLSAAVSFLWGKGNLVEEFNLTKVDRPDYGPVVLELIPKKPQSGFTKLFFVIDPETGMVTTSVIFDSQGNENRVAFTNVKTNQNVADDRFKFQIPKDASVREL